MTSEKYWDDLGKSSKLAEQFQAFKIIIEGMDEREEIIS